MSPCLTNTSSVKTHRHQKFVISLGSTEREHQPNMNQHRRILYQLQNNKYMKQKASRYFKRPQLLYNSMTECLTHGNPTS